MATTTGTAQGLVSANVQRQAFSGYNRLGRILLWVAVIFVTFIAASPFVFSVITSFKTQATSIDGTLIPWLQFQPTLINWQTELNTGGEVTFKSLANSATIAIGATLLASTLGTLAGWGLARFK